MSSHPSMKSPSELSAAVRLATTRLAARTVDAARALPLPLPRALPQGGLYAVFQGPHRHKAVSTAAAGTLLLGLALAAAPGSAVAQTVQPTTPDTSVFTAHHAATAEDVLVRVAAPSAYRLAGGADATQRAVAVAANLTPSPPPAPAPAATATPAATPAPAAAPAWSAPVPGAAITNPFGAPNHEYAAGYHTGVDFAVAPGTPVHAVGNATVVSAAYDGAYGNEIVLHLPDGHFAQYAHLSVLSVHPGQQVTAGQQIGASGSTGNSTGPHLHFEIRSANKYGAVVDPIGYLSALGAGDF